MPFIQHHIKYKRSFLLQQENSFYLYTITKFHIMNHIHLDSSFANATYLHISFIFLLHANLVPSLLFQGQHSIPEYHPAFVQRLRKESSYLLLFQKHATFPIQSILGRFLSYKFANHMVSQIFQCSNVTFC